MGKEKIRLGPDFFVALRNCNSSDNICALFQKVMVFEIRALSFTAYFKNYLFSEINCFIKPLRTEAWLTPSALQVSLNSSTTTSTA